MAQMVTNTMSWFEIQNLISRVYAELDLIDHFADFSPSCPGCHGEPAASKSTRASLP